MRRKALAYARGLHCPHLDMEDGSTSIVVYIGSIRLMQWKSATIPNVKVYGKLTRDQNATPNADRKQQRPHKAKYLSSKVQWAVKADTHRTHLVQKMSVSNRHKRSPYSYSTTVIARAIYWSLAVEWFEFPLLNAESSTPPIVKAVSLHRHRLVKTRAGKLSYLNLLLEVSHPNFAVVKSPCGPCLTKILTTYLLRLVNCNATSWSGSSRHLQLPPG